LTAVTVKITFFLDVRPYSLEYTYRCFVRKSCLQPQGRFILYCLENGSSRILRNLYTCYLTKGLHIVEDSSLLIPWLLKNV